MPKENLVDGQFIFLETEFEDESFHAASFVSKYRRVSSLESLKEQLVTYSNSLKHQLYDIINRDYKDFITISTKLDGVDDRVASLKNPLKDLRINLSSLHEGILASMQAIHDKIKRRVDVSNKKKMIETFLSCIDQLELTQQIVTASKSSYSSHATAGSDSTVSRRERLLSSLDRKIAAKSREQQHQQHSKNGHNASSHATHTTTAINTTSQHAKEVFICSEYERAAYSLSAVRGHLLTLADLLNNNTVDHNMMLNDTNITTLFKQLEQQYGELQTSLVNKIQTKLAYLFTHAMNTAATNAAETTTSLTTKSNAPKDRSSERCYAHCVRSLLALGKGEVAERALRMEVIDPFIKTNIIAGKIDGSEGRGSYSGLQSTLELLIATIHKNMGSLLTVTEEIYAYSKFQSDGPATVAVTGGTAAGVGNTNTIDLILNSIYVPITAHITLHYSNMYSVAIANTLAHCYNAIHHFHTLLYSIAGSKYSGDVMYRVTASKQYKEYQNKWKMDIYYTLRYNEIVNRVDKICDLVVSNNDHSGQNKSNNTTGLLKIYNQSVVDSIYKPAPVSTQTAAAQGTPLKGLPPTAGAKKGALVQGNVVSAEDTTGSAASVVTMTLTQAEFAELKQSVVSPTSRSTAASSAVVNGGYHYSLFSLFAIELLTTLHSKVLLKPLIAKFITLFLRIVVRLDGHLQSLCHVTTATGHEVANAGTAGNVMSTPNKKVLSSPNLTSPAGATHMASASSSSNLNNSTAAGSNSNNAINITLNVDELLFIVHDMFVFDQWLTTHLKSTANTIVHNIVNNIVSADNISVSSRYASEHSATLTPIDSCIASLSTRLVGTRTAVFSKVSGLLVADCRKVITLNVKAIAPKYRMTSKPAPYTHSAFVIEVLKPLRSFLQTHGAIVHQIFHQAAVAAKSVSYAFVLEVLQDVTSHYTEHVRSLIDTVKQIEASVNKRVRNKAAVGLSDSDKIASQILLDVEQYSREIKDVVALTNLDHSLGALPAVEAFVPAYRELRFEIDEYIAQKAASDKAAADA